MAEITRQTPTYTNSSGELMTERLAVGGPGPVPLSDVLAALEAAGDSEVFVHSAFFSWERPSDGDEHQHFLDLQENQRQRTEKWERAMYVRLTAKYGASDG